MSNPSTSRSRTMIHLALLSTILVGLFLRWVLAGQLGLAMPFAHLRHAHSHLGYFGVLFPLAWVGWRGVGASTPGRRLSWVYAAATMLSFIGFLRAGYGIEAIIGSTIVGAVWLWSSLPLLFRMRDGFDPLAVVPAGVVGSLACVPPIAYFLRRDPQLAAGFVATFLSTLLLAVIVPSALATLRVRPAPWPLLGVAAGLGSAALGVWTALPANIGLFVYGAILVRAGWMLVLPHLRAAWTVVGLGLIAVAVGLLPNTRPVALGAIHFLVLGPVLASLAGPWLGCRPTRSAWFLEFVFTSLLAGPLVLQGLGAGPWTMTASAIGGTLVVLWWSVLLTLSLRADPPGKE